MLISLFGFLPTLGHKELHFLGLVPVYIDRSCV